MKKICSLILALIMIIATFAVGSIPAEASVDGDWAMFTAAAQFNEGYNGVLH